MDSPNTTKPTESSLYMFRDVHAPGSFMVTRLISVAMGFSTLSMYIVFVVIVSRAFRRKTQGKHARRFILGLLLGNIMTSIMAEVVWSIGLNAFSGIDINLCNYWARLGGLLYVMSNFFSYMILMQRAEAVGVVKGSGKTEKRLFKITLLLVKVGTACVPLIGLACLVLFEGKTYFIEEYCVEAIIDWLAWVFLFLDTSLSSGYLLLFVIPVVIHMRKMRSVTPAVGAADGTTNRSKKGSGSDSIRATAIRNLKISSCAISSTLTFMIGVSLVSTFASSEDEDLIPYLHLNVFQYYGSAADMLVNVICNMLMTKNLWATKASATLSTKSKYAIKGADGTTGDHESSHLVTSNEVGCD